jgi:peptidoglycan hydrolase CwlO-like protein
MIALLQSLNSIAGFLSIFVLFVVTIISGRYMARSKINEKAIETQKSAIEAMHEEIDILRGRVDDIKSENTEIRKENTRLQMIIETIKTALKGLGLAVTIDGNMVSINDGKSSIAKEIHDKQNGV